MVEDGGEADDVEIKVGDEFVRMGDEDGLFAAGFLKFDELFYVGIGVGSGEFDFSDMDGTGGVMTGSIKGAKLVFYLRSIEDVEEIINSADGNAAEFVVIIITIEGVVDEFGFLDAVFEDTVIIEEGRMIADFLPAFVASARQDKKTVIIITLGVDGETFEAIVDFGGDFGKSLRCGSRIRGFVGSGV